MEPREQGHFLESMLDAALERYGAAEPRPGLENRVLTSLRAEQQRMAARSWTWWPALAGLTAALLLAAAMFVAHRPNTMTKKKPALSSHGPGASTARHPDTLPAVKRKPAGAQTVRREIPSPQVEAVKRAQFPSPVPLSEQEKILARYVRDFPESAVLLAGAQTELRKAEEMERAQPWPRPAELQESKPQDR